MVFSSMTRLLSFLFKIYLSRKVGAEILGLIQMSISVFALFCTLSASGIPLILSRKTAELTALHKEKELHSVFTGALLLSLGVTVILITGAFLLKKQIEPLFSDKRCIPLFYIILPSLLSTVLYQLVRGYLMGRKKYIEYSFTEFLEEVLRIILCISLLSNVLIVIAKEIAIAIALTVTDYIVMIILLIIYFTKGGRLTKPSGIKLLLRSGTPITLMRIAAGFISSFIAIALPAALIRGGLSANEAAAEYGRAVGMAYSLLFAPLSLTSALSVVILPEAATLAAEGKWEDLRKRVNRSIVFIFLITTYFYALYFVLGECFGEMLFGDVKAGRFVAFSAGMVIPVALSGLINTILNSLGEEKKVFLGFTISALLLILCILILPQYIGIYALAVSECVFYLVQFMIGMVFLYKKKAYDSEIFRPIGKTLLIAVPGIFIMKIIDSLIAGKSATLRALIGTVVGTALYIVMIVLFRPIDVKAFLVRFLRRREKKSSRFFHSFRPRHKKTMEEGRQ